MAVLLLDADAFDAHDESDDGSSLESKPESEPEPHQHQWGLMSSKEETASLKTARVIQALEVLDQDQKGYVSSSDLQRVATSLGTKFTDEELKEMLVAADGDPDVSSGNIQYDDVKLAISSLRSVQYERGEVIIEEGSTTHASEFYFLLNGKVEMSCVNPLESKTSSNFITLQHFEPGDCFGEVESLVDSSSSSSSSRAQVRAKAQTIRREPRKGRAVHPRIASYKCMTDVCHVLCLHPQDLRLLMYVIH